MKGGKDEGKLMDPLFPRLHIDDADKGGPKAPPRNKMAMLPIQPTNDHTSSLPQASSSEVGHRLATFCGLPGSSHLAEIYQSYYSTAVNVKTPLGNSEPSELESSNYQNPCVSGNSRTKSNSLRPHGFDEVSEFDDKALVPAMNDSLRSFPTHRDGYGLIGTATINECSKDEDCGPMQGEDAGKKQETLDTSVAECTPVVDLTQVQRLIAGSLQVFSENIFNLNVKPSTKFPPTKKLLFAIPLNPSPVVTKRKVDALNPGKHHGAEAEGDFAQQPTPPTNYNAKIVPWCFHPPGNQWLSPAESPSEGLIHEPYKGLGPPTPSIMGPVFGHQQPVNLSTMGKTVYGVPAVDFQGTRHFPGGAFGESCLRHSPVLDLNQTIPFAGAQSAGTDKGSLVFDANVAISCKTSCNMVNQSSLVVLDSGEILHGPQADWWQEDALFPTTAAVLCSKDHYNQSLQVIKVVPHDPKSARESAARIFQSFRQPPYL